MNLEKLYKMQEELDNHILENIKNRTGKEMGKGVLLENTVLALQVEVAELANATRCFKHWSVKESEARERLLEELADVWHFYLSVGNQIGMANARIEHYHKREELKDDKYDRITQEFTRLMLTGGTFYYDREWYCTWGYRLEVLGEMLGFTDEEVEQAYLRKHEENYRRQREGY